MPDGARALRAAVPRDMLKPWSRSIPASIHSAPRSRRNICKARSRPRASSKARATRWSSRSPAMRRAPSHEARLDTQALLGERVMVYETTDEGWAWGQLESDGYVGWLSANALGQAGPGADPQGLGAAHARLSRDRTSSCRRRSRCRWARRSPSCGRTNVSRITANGWHLPVVHLAPIKARQPDFVAVAEQFLQRALSVGRQDVARHRLLGTGASRAAGRRPRLPARQRHAGTGARQIVVARASCGAAIWCSGRATSPSRATAKRLLHANAHHMMVAIEPAADGRRAHQGGGQRRHQREADLASAPCRRSRTRPRLSATLQGLTTSVAGLRTPLMT